MRRRALLAIVTTALLAPAAAQAGVPFTVGEGASPHLLVDGAGTAHVTWSDETPRVFYCRVPRGAAGCAVLRALSSDIGGRPFIVHGGGGTLYIAMNDYSGRRTLLWRSADNGANWSPPQQIYAWGGGTDAAEPLVGPQAGQLTFASSNPQTTAWGAALDGSESGTDARATLSESAVHDVRAALTGDGGAIVVANDLTNT
ncbi:MAG TPA: hypothetical protein VGW10_08170, partial [Solirubrobacteraceae bacterium]|nr:hypothetical protein [Solirubrobacteraceae bacterium]